MQSALERALMNTILGRLSGKLMKRWPVGGVLASIAAVLLLNPELRRQAAETLKRIIESARRAKQRRQTPQLWAVRSSPIP